MRTVVALLLYSQLVVGEFVRDCTPQPHLNCSLYKLNGIECSLRELQVRFPELYKDTDIFPGKPHDFNSSVDKHKLSVNLTFTPTRDVGILYVKGFEITETRSDKTEPTCYIFDMSRANWTATVEEKKTVFWQQIGPLKQLTLYQYTIYALPKPSPIEFDDYWSQNINVQISQEDEETAQSWRPTIYYRKFEAEGRIEVYFELPPEKYKFKKFFIYLKNMHTGKTIPKTREPIDRNSFNFTSVDPGNYTIRVQAYDPYRGEDDANKCLCVIGNTCELCVTTATKVFSMQYVPTTPSPTTSTSTSPSPTTSPSTSTTTKLLPLMSNSDSSYSSVKIGMAVIGSVLGLTLTIVALLCIYRHRFRETQNLQYESQTRDLDNEGSVETFSVITMDRPNVGKENGISVKHKMKFAKRPKLFLLFEDDHEHHRLVVDKFASYLQQHCQCDVMCAEWQLDTAWVHEDLSCADYLVIINSEKAYNLYMKDFGRKGNQDSPPTRNRYSSSINSIRNQFLQEERYDNIVMVYFEYTDERFLIPDICPGYKYELLKNFTEFLLHIHKLHRTDNLSRYDLPIDGIHNHRPIGQQMVDAIIAACQHEHIKPRKELVMLRTCSKTSDPDSQVDSGLPDDIGPPGVTPNTDKPEQQFQSEIQHQLIKYLDSISQDAVTIAPPDVPNPSTPAITTNQVLLSPLQIGKFNTDSNPYTPSPLTADSTGIDFDFVPPDDESDFDAISKSQSEQMKCIVDRYQAANTPTRADQPANRMGTISESQPGGYIKNVDLEMLKINDNFIFQVGEDTISLGGKSV